MRAEDLLRYQIEFSGWANERVLTAASGLNPDELAHDFKSSERSILGTLVHIYRAERVWLARIEGNPVGFVSPGDDTMAALSKNWPLLSERWIRWAHVDADAAREVSYHDLRDNLWTHPTWKIVHQVVNHASHHRGQAIGFIRALGHVPPNVDSITFARGQ